MYNRGLIKFMERKKLSSRQAIGGFLASEGVTISRHDYRKVNSYIQDNWVKFCSFVDRGLQEGILQGKRVKLNTYYDEQEAYRARVTAERESVVLNDEQKRLLDYIKANGVSQIQSVMMLQGIQPVKKNYDYESKYLQWLPLADQMIEHGVTM